MSRDVMYRVHRVAQLAVGIWPIIILCHVSALAGHLHHAVPDTHADEAGRDAGGGGRG